MRSILNCTGLNVHRSGVGRSALPSQRYAFINHLFASHRIDNLSDLPLGFASE